MRASQRVVGLRRASVLTATVTTTTALLLGLATTGGTATAASAAPDLAPVTVAQPSAEHPRHSRVSTATYNLGDGAFVDPQVTYFDNPRKVVRQELTAVVHYPTHLGREKHPLIMVVHGSWWTCVNRSSRKPTNEWPCAKGTQPLRSNRGYDYIGRSLARRGFVVVSISTNAINAHVLGDADYVGRAHLLNKHLNMWQRLVNRGAGPLRGAFIDPRTGRRVHPRFRGHVDTRDVGTIGHSRGGKAVMWQASDKHRSEWPPRVRVRAVLPLAPVYFTPPGENNRNTLVTKIPFKVITSTCDGDTGEVGTEYVDEAADLNPGASLTRIVGGNHNFFNTRWSPGQIGGKDDGTRPCAGKLTAAQQRRQTKRIVVRFFEKELRRP